MPPKTKRKQQGVGAHCSVLLKYLYPKEKINEVIPPNGRINKQELLIDSVHGRVSVSTDHELYLYYNKYTYSN